MKTAIMVDSACDLPSDYLEKHDIHIIPINVQFMEYYFKDQRDAKLTASFYKKYADNKTAEISSRPSSVDQIRNLIITKIARQYENVLVMCITSTRSEIYNNATKAVKMVPDVLRGINKPELIKLKELHVLDTHTLFSGQAVLTYEAIDTVEKGTYSSLVDLANHITHLSQFVYTYTVLEDLFYVRHRAKLRGEKSIGPFAYFLGTSLDVKPIILMHQGETSKIAKCRGFDQALEELFSIAEEAVSGGLLIKTVMISYAGETADIKRMSRFKEFKSFSEQHGVSVHLSVMSTTAGIYVGPGAISLSYCG